MILRLAAAGLILLGCFLPLAFMRREPVKSSPSALESSCPTRAFYVPCFIKDEALQPTWNV